MNAKKTWQVCAAAILALPLLAFAADGNFDRTFLSDYTKLQAKPTAKGTEYIHISPGVLERLGQYNGVMVDQPEVLISPQSDYKGAKPEDLSAIAAMMRETLSQQLTSGGYYVVQAPQADVIYIRLALTDLKLKKKKRNILGYTPVGFVVKAGADMVRDMMDKYDIMGMTLQAELTDSKTNEVLGAVVAERGAASGKERIDFDELEDQVESFGSRLRCRLDNARVAAAEQIDCMDQKARQAREAAKAAQKP